MTAVSRDGIRLLDGEFWAREPYAELAWLREHEPVFWDDALRVLGVASLDPLQSLVGRELVVERAASSLQGKREFNFRHHTLHLVSY